MEDSIREAILELAPRSVSLADLGRAVNEAEGLDWSAAKWRGIWKSELVLMLKVRKLLGTDRPRKELRIAVDRDARGVVYSDVHSPFHDRKAIALAKKITRWWQPDVAVWNGDDMDCYMMTDSFDRSPERRHTLQDEADQWQIEVAGELCEALEAVGCHDRFKTGGNHDEDRIQRQLARNPQFFGLRALDIPELLGLDLLGIRYATHSVRVANLLEISHGSAVSKWAGSTAQKEAARLRYDFWTMTGHVHRAALSGTRSPRMGWMQHVEVPCLCSLQPEYMLDPDWVQGMGLFEIYNGMVWLMPVVFTDDYRAQVGKDRFSL